MYWYVIDETNRDYQQDHFFIVGGLVLTEDQFWQTDVLVRQIRESAGYVRGDSFKFDTRARPAQVSIEIATKAKGDLLVGLEKIGVRMIVYVILHDLCMEQSYDVRMNWALNTIVYAYHNLLAAEKADGVVMLDRDNGRYDHLEHLFQQGLQFPGGQTFALDSRIKLFGMTNDNASHVSSAADVALGAFRYCVNTAGGWGRDEVARSMFPTISRLIYGVEERGVRRLAGHGFHARPKYVGKPEFKERYAALTGALAEYAIAKEQ